MNRKRTKASGPLTIAGAAEIVQSANRIRGKRDPDGAHGKEYVRASTHRNKETSGTRTWKGASL